MTFLAYAFISMLPVNYRLSSRYRGANWEYQGDVCFLQKPNQE